MLDLKENNVLLKMKEQMVHDIKVEVKDIDTDKQIKEIKIEINTNKSGNIQQTKKEVKKGQLWYVNFGQRQGSLQSGIRPALVESNNINNRFSNIINVSPLTSNMAKASNIPVHVLIDGFGLKEPSVILIEQGTPIDVRYQLLTYIGTVDELVSKKVKKAREIQLGDMIEKTPLERLSQEAQNIINDKLEDIRGLERTISNITRQSLIKHLMEERESKLLLLERICIKYNLNYKDYYVMYKREDIKSIM